MIDQGLKERLTGAVVLVVLGVIIIPLFLDGPDANSGGSEQRTLELPGADPNPTDSAAGTSQSSAGRQSVDAQPGGVQTGAGAEAGSAASGTRTAGAESGQESARESARPPLAVAKNPLSAWAVQVGSFSSRDNAERLSEDLKKRGYRAFVTRLNANSRTMYRVRVGPEPERERAELLARRLKKDGQAADVVTHP